MKSILVLILCLIAFDLKADIIFDNSEILIVGKQDDHLFGDHPDSLYYQFDFLAPSKFEIITDHHFELIDLGKKRKQQNYRIVLPYFNGDLDVKIRFDLPLRISTPPKQELFHMHNIINPQHFSEIKNKKRPSLLEETKWYDPEMDLIEIKTNEDAVYQINMSDILDLRPEWAGERKIYLHALNNGQEYDLFFVSNEDPYIDANDKIYLLGKRNKGDTTYIDNYSDDQSFYFYLDTEDASNSLNLINSDSGLPRSRSAFREFHIEKDNIYYLGYYFAGSETQIGENWYMDIIESKPINEANFMIDIPLIKEDGNDHEVNVNFHSLYYVVEDNKKNDYEIRFDLNNQYYWIEEFSNLKEYDFPVDGISERIINGANKINIFTEEVSGNDFGRIGINSFHVKGNLLSYSIDDIVSFKNTSNRDNSQRLFGFSSNEIAAIDRTNKTIQLPNSSKRVLVAGGLDLTSQFSSLMIDDHYFSSIENYSLLILDQNGISTKLEYSSEEDLISGIRSIKESSLFGIAIRSEISSQLTIELSSLGFNNIDSGDELYLLFGQKGNSDNNKISSSNEGLISEFFEFDIQGHEIYSTNISSRSNAEITASSLRKNAEISLVEKTHLRDFESKRYDLIYITSDEYFNTALSYVESRKAAYPDMEVDLINVKDIYKEYNYGVKSPHAIKDFLREAYYDQIAPAPSFLCLIGDASWDLKFNLPESVIKDEVPTFGLPVSDAWYVMLDEENDTNLDMMVGRIPINSAFDLLAYQNKLETFESSPPDPWLKKMLMLIGGNSSESRVWSELVSAVFDDMVTENFCGDTSSVVNNSESASNAKNASTIINELDDGRFWTIFAGHGSAQLFDMDGWQVEKLRNIGKTGFLSTAACNVGAFAEPKVENSRSESYINYPQVGFVGVFSSTNFDVMEQDLEIIKNMIYSLKDTVNPSRTSGELINIGKAFLPIKGDWLDKVHQYGLLGDPSAKIPLSIKPDLYFANDIKLTPIGNNDDIIDAADSLVRIDLSVYNNGLSNSLDFDIQMIHTYSDQSDTSIINMSDHCFFDDSFFSVNILDKPGSHQIRLTIDPDVNINESRRDNNFYSIEFDVFNKGLLTLDPLENWNVDHVDPIFRFIDPIDELHEYEFEIYNTFGDLIYSYTNDEIVDYQTHVDWIPEVDLDENTTYLLSYNIKNTNENDYKRSSIFFNTISDSTYRNVDLVIESYPDAYQSSKNIDFSNGSVYLTNDTIKADLISSNGKGNYISRATINVGEELFVDRDIRGFNVVTYPKIKDTDLLPRYKVFDTWGLSYDDKGLPVIDTATSISLVEFLKDSVSQEEYLLISISNEAFYTPLWLRENSPNSIGSIDSLVFYLKNYGSEFADSLTNGWSYLAVFDPSKGKLAERAILNDSLNAETDLILYNTSSDLISQVIGPARKWNSFTINSEQIIDADLITTSSRNGSSNTFSVINNEVNISELDASMFTFKLILNNSDINNIPVIDNIHINFIPEPELAVINVKDSLDEILRGDDLSIPYQVRNLSLRIEAEENSNSIVIVYNTLESSIELIDINSTSTFSQDIISNFITGDQIANISAIDVAAKRELYYFNNTSSVRFKVTEDTIPPVLVLKADGKELIDQDFISKDPELLLEMYDNSKLPVTSINNFVQLNLNGFGNIRNSSTFEGSFDPSIHGNLKARVYLPTDELESGDKDRLNQNFLDVVAEDPSGNQTSMLIYFNISANGYLLEPINYPNPFNEITSISFNYVAPEHNTVLIKIYDLNGNIIRVIENSISVGINNIEWDGKDDYGNSIPRGSYYYSIKVTGSTYADPIKGNMLKMD